MCSLLFVRYCYYLLLDQRGAQPHVACKLFCVSNEVDDHCVICKLQGPFVLTFRNQLSTLVPVCALWFFNNSSLRDRNIFFVYALFVCLISGQRGPRRCSCCCCCCCCREERDSIHPWWEPQWWVLIGNFSSLTCLCFGSGADLCVTGIIWSAHCFRQDVDMPSWPGAFLVSCLWKIWHIILQILGAWWGGRSGWGDCCCWCCWLCSNIGQGWGVSVGFSTQQQRIVSSSASSTNLQGHCLCVYILLSNRVACSFYPITDVCPCVLFMPWCFNL